MPKTRKASSLVTVLKGTDIIYDPATALVESPWGTTKRIQN